MWRPRGWAAGPPWGPLVSSACQRGCWGSGVRWATARMRTSGMEHRGKGSPDPEGPACGLEGAVGTVCRWEEGRPFLQSRAGGVGGDAGRGVLQGRPSSPAPLRRAASGSTRHPPRRVGDDGAETQAPVRHRGSGRRCVLALLTDDTWSLPHSDQPAAGWSRCPLPATAVNSSPEAANAEVSPCRKSFLQIKI